MQVQAHVETRKKFHWFSLVIAEYSICTLGHFAVMAILSLYFIHSLNLPTAQAGWMMLFTSLSFRISRIFLSPLVSRFPVRLATCMALFLTSLGYIGMAFSRTPWLIMPLLLTVGIGHGTNTLLVKIMAASTGGNKKTDKADAARKSPFMRYASLNTGINVSAAFGSFVGSTLLFHSSASAVFLLAAMVYAISGCIAIAIPSQDAGGTQRPNWNKGLKLTLRVPALWRAMLFGFLGWFMYTQSYASLPLFVSEAVHRKDLLGSVFVVNAILVIIGQLPISQLIMRLRIPTSQIVIFAFLTFGAGFALLWFIPVWQMVYVAVLLWTLGEILIMPALDTLVAEGALAEYKQVAFTLNSVAVGLGEGIGNFAGVAIAGFFLKLGNLQNLYMLLTIAALLAATTAVFIGNRRESMVHRLIAGMSLIPTWQTQMLQPLPLFPGNRTEKLLAWLSAPTSHEERSFLETHPEVLAMETGQLDTLLEQQPELGQHNGQMLAQRIRLLNDVRQKMVEYIRESYVNAYGGLILDLPPWLESIKQELVVISQDSLSEQIALKRMTLLQQAIKRAKVEREIALETIAELQVLYAIAGLETPLDERALAIEAAIQKCQEALTVYTLARYPYQYVRTQIFLSLAYQNRLQGERRINLEKALACYEAASAAHKESMEKLLPLTTDLTQNNRVSQLLIDEHQVMQREALHSCKESLQKCLSEAVNSSWVSEQKTTLLSLPDSMEDDPNQSTLLTKGLVQTMHVKWIARQTTQSL